MRLAEYGGRAVILLASLGFFACDVKPHNQNGNNRGNAPIDTGALAFQGVHDITNCNGIIGWAWDKNRPNDPVEVDVYDGDTLLATMIADQFRKDLLDAGIGNGKHSFLFPVPPRLKDGSPHLIRMKFSGAKVDLAHTPKVLKCNVDQ
jgi:hypothetical protein